MRTSPSIKATAERLGARLLERSPNTLRELLTIAKEEAARTITDTTENREHLTTLTALIALSAHAFTQDGAVRARFPRFLSDGRELTREANAEEGIDKAWHAINHAMFSYVTLFDAHFGDGATSRAFLAGVNGFDPEANGPKLAEVYEATGGRVGGLAPLSLPGPHEDTPAYFSRPTDLTADEGMAYDAAVRVGDAYEVWSTRLFPQYAPPDVSALRRHGRIDDPVAKVDDTRWVHSGVADVGVARDLTANRIGADLGVRLFRNAASIPRITYDDGAQFALRPFAPGAKGPFSAFVSHEAALISKLGITAQPLPTEPAEAARALIECMNTAVDTLATSNRDALSRYYASLSVRVLALGVFHDEGPNESPHFDDHQKWAATAPPEAIKTELARRVNEIAQAHVLKDLQGLITQRAMFDRSVGRLSGRTTALGDGAVQTVNGPNYFAGQARLVANPATNSAHVVMRGFLQVWESTNTFEALGLPRTDEQSDGADGATQEFDRGVMTWNPRDGVRVTLTQNTPPP